MQNSEGSVLRTVFVVIHVEFRGIFFKDCIFCHSCRIQKDLFQELYLLSFMQNSEGSCFKNCICCHSCRIQRDLFRELYLLSFMQNSEGSFSRTVFAVIHVEFRGVCFRDCNYNFKGIPFLQVLFHFIYTRATSQVSISHVVAMGAERCGQDGLEGLATPLEQARWAERCGQDRLGNCTFGKLALGKIPLGSCRLKKCVWESTKHHIK